MVSARSRTLSYRTWVLYELRASERALTLHLAPGNASCLFVSTLECSPIEKGDRGPRLGRPTKAWAGISSDYSGLRPAVWPRSWAASTVANADRGNHGHSRHQHSGHGSSIRPPTLGRTAPPRSRRGGCRDHPRPPDPRDPPDLPGPPECSRCEILKLDVWQVCGAGKSLPGPRPISHRRAWIDLAACSPMAENMHRGQGNGDRRRAAVHWRPVDQCGSSCPAPRCLHRRAKAPTPATYLQGRAGAGDDQRSADGQEAKAECRSPRPRHCPGRGP